MKISDKILALRRQKGMSQEQLSECLGISRQAVSKWESDQSLPELNNVLQLSRVFGVTTDYLLDDSVDEPEVKRTPDVLSWDAKKTERAVAPISAALLLIGLLVAGAGFMQWQTIIPVAAGFIVQIGGCLFYFLSSLQAGKGRLHVPAWLVWMMLPIPVCLMLSVAFGFRSSYNTVTRRIVTVALLITIAIGAVTAFVSRKRK